MIELMPHQKEAVENLSSGKILYGKVGTGKSVAALYYYAEKDMFGDLYVITTAKKRDSLEWEKDAAALGIFPELEGFPNYEKLHVDSWNNIAKYEDVKDCTFIFDEQRLVGSGAWVKSFYKIAKRNAWIVLTATPGDTWSDFIPVFIANGYFKNRSQFSREHIVWAPYVKFPKIERYVGIDKLQRLKNEVLIEMPYEKHTCRDLKYISVDYDKQAVDTVLKDRWNPFLNEPIMNVSELFSVMRKIVYTDPSRLAWVTLLMEKHPRLIIFYQFNYELEILRSLNDTWSDLVQIAEWNGHRKQPIPDSKNWLYFVQYQAGAESWNCTSTDAMIFYSLTYSYKKFEQAQGRIDRMTTLYKDLSYYALFSKSPIDRAVRKALASKKNFNEKKWFVEQFGENDELFKNDG